jgi:opacity protein-like surface antigen
MKKIMILAIAACFAGTAANAQDVYKQTGGEQNIEVLFAPFGGSPIGINGIKYRKFTSATEAWRAEVFVGFSSNTDVTGLTADEDELRDRSGAFDIELTVGKEWHLPGTDRLSPYWGPALNVGFGNSSERSEFVNEGSTDIEESKTTGGSLTVGAALFGGADYYVADNVYIGAEIGIGVAFTTLFDTTTSFSVDGVDDVTTPNGGSFNFGPVAQARLRLGILF